MFVAIPINSASSPDIVDDITGQSKGQVFRKLVQMGLDPNKFNIIEQNETLKNLELLVNNVFK